MLVIHAVKSGNTVANMHYNVGYHYGQRSPDLNKQEMLAIKEEAKKNYDKFAKHYIKGFTDGYNT